MKKYQLLHPKRVRNQKRFIKDEGAVSSITGIILLIVISVFMFFLISGTSLTEAGKVDEKISKKSIGYKIEGNILTFMFVPEKIPTQYLDAKVVNTEQKTIQADWNTDYIQSGTQIVNYNRSEVGVKLIDKKLGRIYVDITLGANPNPVTAGGSAGVGFENGSTTGGDCVGCSVGGGGIYFP